MTLLQVNFNEAFRSLWGSRQRSLLALIGIVIGIGSVIGMVSIGTIVQQEAVRQFKDMGIDIMAIRTSFDNEKTGGFRTDDIFRLPEMKRSVLAVAPYINGSTEYTIRRQKFNMDQIGVTASFFDLNKLVVLEGRALSDLDQNRFFCVVGAELADFMRANGVSSLIGRSIPSEDRTYKVVGVIEKSAEGGLRPYGINHAILVPLSTALRTFQNAEIKTIQARVAPQISTAQVRQDVQAYFAQKAKGMKVEVASAEELIDQMKKQMQMFALLLGAIGSISLIVGGIGVMNVMLISVAERRSEIGLRRALGAQRGDIQSQFLIESVLLCLAGGIIGIILGIGISYIFAYFSKMVFIMSYFSILLGFGVSTAVGVFCGFYPARTAARLDPIKALRS